MTPEQHRSLALRRGDPIGRLTAPEQSNKKNGPSPFGPERPGLAESCHATIASPELQSCPRSVGRNRDGVGKRHRKVKSPFTLKTTFFRELGAACSATLDRAASSRGYGRGAPAPLRIPRPEPSNGCSVGCHPISPMQNGKLQQRVKHHDRGRPSVSSVRTQSDVRGCLESQDVRA